MTLSCIPESENGVGKGVSWMGSPEHESLCVSHFIDDRIQVSELPLVRGAETRAEHTSQTTHQSFCCFEKLPVASGQGGAGLA